MHSDQRMSNSKKNIYLEVIASQTIEGSVLKSRFLVNHPLDQGSFGTIYECIDLDKPSSINVIKISNNYRMLGNEIEALKDIKNTERENNFDYPYDYTPLVVSKGMFILQKDNMEMEEDSNDMNGESPGKQFMSFYVMPKYGKNLETYFNQYNQRFRPKTILQLGIKMVEIIEKIHDAGYTYNDLKLDNILIGGYTQQERQLHEIRLVDFGFAQKFVDS